MCNIAGYIGNRPASGILSEMMKKQSGFLGGYYSGIVTVDEGGLYMKKLMGDMDRLENLLEKNNVPGNIGIIHSRSKAGGDDHWAHPFLSYDEKIAYIANGSTGKFANICNAQKTIGLLEDKGITFDSASDKMGAKYIGLRDGRRIHVSEMMAHYIRYIQQSESRSLDESMSEAFKRCPSEIVGLCVNADDPHTIYFARYNMPLFIARTADEVFLSSTPLAFPEDRKYISMSLIPECSYGTITLKRTKIYRFESEIPASPITPSIWSNVRAKIISELQNSDEPIKYSNLAKSTKELWPQDCLAQVNAAAYEILYELYKENSIEIVKKEAPGADEGLDMMIKTTVFFVRKKNEFQVD